MPRSVPPSSPVTRASSASCAGTPSRRTCGRSPTTRNYGGPPPGQKGTTRSGTWRSSRPQPTPTGTPRHSCPGLPLPPSPPPPPNPPRRTADDDPPSRPGADDAVGPPDGPRIDARAETVDGLRLRWRRRPGTGGRFRMDRRVHGGQDGLRDPGEPLAPVLRPDLHVVH